MSRKPSAGDVMDTMASSPRIPLAFTNWLFTWCVRCDRVVVRPRHCRRCPCVHLVAEPGSELAEIFDRLIAADVSDDPGDGA